MSRRPKRPPTLQEQLGLRHILPLLAVSLGTALAMILGSGFVFYHSDRYAELAVIGFPILLPLITLALLLSPQGKQWRSRFTLARVPQVFGWAFGIVLVAAAITASPLGYIALINEVHSETAIVDAQVVAVVQHEARRGRRERDCEQSAIVLVLGKRKNVCLDDYYQADDHLQGEKVLMKIRRSPFGFSIGEMQRPR